MRVLRHQFREFLPKDLMLRLIRMAEHYCTMQLRLVMKVSITFCLSKDLSLMLKILINGLQSKHVRQRCALVLSGMEQI
ncbi:hypothetical protein ANAPC1_00854 [Anaplasma phagocytophilum]|uniref:Uncharacterized protein n=1 Tax=Anaplasma phagocytophilum TaxID=948 RepID=A0AA45UTP3_ANAPH|nr:hypothetical protein ANAPC1_00854 [Anaplasma phagocytophilum]